MNNPLPIPNGDCGCNTGFCPAGGDLGGGPTGGCGSATGVCGLDETFAMPDIFSPFAPLCYPTPCNDPFVFCPEYPCVKPT